jgi:hypothetical protein
MRNLINCTLVFTVFLTGSILAESINTTTVSRRNISVSYALSQIDDGFGNVRELEFSGRVENNSQQIASSIRINILFELVNRGIVERTISITNLLPDESQPLDLVLDFGTQPDSVISVTCNIDQVLFAATREPSALTPYHLVTHEYYSIPRLNEEGRSFMRVLDYVRSIKPFHSPPKDEFETTTEYEVRVNTAENEHFFEIMDDLETRYGLLIGGANTRIRFLPRVFRDDIVYMSECSANFHVRFGLGRYNADLERFENVFIVPRTIPFSPRTLVPQTDMQFLHRTGIFFLRSTDYPISREEAQTWRLQDDQMILDVTIRLGVRQNGPDIQDFCIVERVLLKNKETGEVFREWHISS